MKEISGKKKSLGIRKVWINGTPVLDGEELDGEAIKASGRSITV